MSKETLYKGKEVVIATGHDATRRAAEEVGMPLERAEKMKTFSSEIIEQAQKQGISPGECFLASLNVMCVILLTVAKTDDERNALISATTESLCAIVGGGSDDGVRS